MPYSIRPAILADCAAISEVAAHTFALACPPSTPQSEIDAYIKQNLQLHDFERMVEDANLRLLVALADGAAIGFSLVTLQPDALGIAAADGIAELSKCYVAAEHHGAGVARLLAEHALSGIDGPVRLTVSEANARASRFINVMASRSLVKRRFRWATICIATG